MANGSENKEFKPGHQIVVTDQMVERAWQVLETSGWLDYAPPGPSGLLVKEMLVAALDVQQDPSQMLKSAKQQI